MDIQIDIRIILEAIDKLPPKGLLQVQQHVDQRVQKLDKARREIVNARTAASNPTLAKQRKDITPDEWKQIANAMNNK